MSDGKIIFNDVNYANDRKAALVAKVESLMEEDLEGDLDFATRSRRKSSYKFNEKLHPRNSAGLFVKKPAKKVGKVFQPIPKGVDIRSKVQVEGDQGFKDVLVGLALGAINEVMNVPTNLINIVIKQSDFERPGLRGQYTFADKVITIDTTEPSTRAETVIHEIAHLLDYNSSLGISYLKDDPTADRNRALKQALFGSQAIRRLSELFSAKSTSTAEQRAFASYLLTPTEIYARAFSQYIALRASNQTLKREFAERRRDEAGTLWEDDDFEPIAREFDKVFKPKVNIPPPPKKKKRKK